MSIAAVGPHVIHKVGDRTRPASEGECRSYMYLSYSPLYTVNSWGIYFDIHRRQALIFVTFNWWIQLRWSIATVK